MSTFFRRDDWVTDAMGNAQSGASVYVCSQPATTGTIPPSPLVQLYSDPAGANPITQPVVTDGYGHAFYYLAAGTYTVVYYSPQIQEVVLPDQLIGGSGVTFPVAVNQGGTGATTASQALINLGGAARGANSDITSLASLSTLLGAGPTPIVVTGHGGVSETALSVTDGVHSSNWTTQGVIDVNGINCTGGAVVAGLQSSSTIVADQYSNATPGGPITILNNGGSAISLKIVGAGVSQETLLGFVTYPTQTTVGAAGGASALPATPTLYLQLSVNGTVYVCPLYARV